MKTTRPALLLLLVFIAILLKINGLAQSSSHAADKHALIIAIGDYPPGNGWMDISSLNDVPLIRGALMLHGFEERNITQITDSQATKEGILKIFNTFSETVSEGDVVVIHYSGHGQQVEDSGKQDEADGLDESLVPYDAPADYKRQNYEGENHLTDDERNGLLTGLRIKLGPEGNVLVILDACESGTATRGLNRTRGTDKIMASKEYIESVKGRSDDNPGFAGVDFNADELATMVVISGASPNQSNQETTDENGIGVGSLSYAFSRAMANSSKETSYRTLFDKIQVDMLVYAPLQSPQIEGDLDQEILGGNAVPYIPYFTPQKYYDNTTIGLGVGQLSGLLENTKVAFYDTEVYDFESAEPKATGYIGRSNLFTSQVNLDSPLTKKEALNSKVMVTAPGYGTMLTKVKLDIHNNPELINNLKTEMEEIPAITIAEEGEPFDLLVELNNEYTKRTRGANFLQFSSAQEQLLFSKEVGNANLLILSNSITDYALEYARANYLKGMEMEDSAMKVSITIIPYDVKLKGEQILSAQPISIEQFMNGYGSLVFKDSTFFKLKFKNEGIKDVYYTVLNILSNNNIDVLVPWEGSEPEDFLLESGKSYETEVFYRFEKPFGNEMLKVIATKDPIDLRPLITVNRSSQPKDELNPIEQLVHDACRGTRAKVVAPVGSANIENVVFTVTE